MKMSKVWEILNRFKHLCERHGWKTCQNEDWVEMNDSYHNFLWTRKVHTSSFRKLLSNGKCVVREGLSYHVVKPSYTAWVFSETPSEELVKIVFENPNFLSKTAIYDLSSFLTGKKRFFKVNNTDSPVFQEFENFLASEFKAKSQPFLFSSEPKTKSDSLELPQLA